MKLEEHVLLAPLTTFRIGGEARHFCRVRTLDELSEALAFARAQHLEVFILGGGSNVLVSDAGFDGLVIKMEMKGVAFKEADGRVEATVGAGENWDVFVALTVEKGLHGLENLSGIPGTVGGAPIQNIGAYGAEAADAIVRVEALDPSSDTVRSFSKAGCAFGYRDSFFKHDGSKLIVTAVVFSLAKSGEPNLSYRDVRSYFARMNANKPSLVEVRNAVIDIRKGKFPDLSRIGTAGSFFKNPVVSAREHAHLKEMFPDMPAFETEMGKMKLPLAWLIDHIAKLKDARTGDAGVFEKQALVVCNFGSARASDVLSLARTISDSVFAATGIEIEPEVRIV